MRYFLGLLQLNGRDLIALIHDHFLVVGFELLLLVNAYYGVIEDFGGR